MQNLPWRCAVVESYGMEPTILGSVRPIVRGGRVSVVGHAHTSIEVGASPCIVAYRADTAARARHGLPPRYPGHKEEEGAPEVSVARRASPSGAHGPAEERGGDPGPAEARANLVAR